MSSVVEGGEHLVRELTPEPMGRPAAGSLAVHAMLAAGIIFYGVFSGLFHHDIWGNPGAGGSMNVSLVNALPLPADQLNQNVLATQTPSQAPAVPSQKTQRMEDLKAVPILGRHRQPKRETVRKTQPHQPLPNRQDVARYGEQAGSQIQRVLQTQGGSSVATAASGDFGSMFPWYVDQINRTMSANWYPQTVDPRTPRGTRAYITFTIHRNGSWSDIRLDRSSGSPTLDQSCANAANRVASEGFIALPSAYNQSTLRVSFYCEY